MERLKFRAWDSWWGKMYYFDFTKNIEATPDDELKGLWILHEEGSVYAIQDKIKIMQYTGLKDKNGKEIYEGDIVLYKYASYRDISKVIYNTKIASFEMVAIKEDDNKSMTKFKKGRTRNFVEGCVNGYDYVKVIGNIYENSKFLESGE